MNIDELTLAQLKEINNLFGGCQCQTGQKKGIDFLIGNKVIIRTFSSGVWFGTLSNKSGNEIILNDARRLWQWFAIESISLSSLCQFGIDQSKSKIAPAVSNVWLEAIEILPCSDIAIKTIEECKNAPQ